MGKDYENWLSVIRINKVNDLIKTEILLREKARLWQTRWQDKK